jgi:hypothetical protein
VFVSDTTVCRTGDASKVEWHGGQKVTITAQWMAKRSMSREGDLRLWICPSLSRDGSRIREPGLPEFLNG